MSLDESGISTGDDIGMRYEFHAHDIGGFMTAPGVPQGKFSSSRWEDEEMSGITFTGHGKEQALDALLDRSLDRRSPKFHVES